MDEDSRNQSPIFSKTYDFILWLLDHTEKYPKSERFRMAKRIEESVMSFYQLLIQATRAGEGKLATLRQADLELESLRLYLRMARDRRLTSQRQYRYIAGELVEIGKLLGGWMKKLKQT